MKVMKGRGAVGAGGYPAGGRGARPHVSCRKCGAVKGRRCVSLRVASRVYRKTCHQERIDDWKALLGVTP